MKLSMVLHREQDPTQVAAIARAAEDAGLTELWFIEDLLFNTGPSLAAVALASTESLVVGTGIIPVAHRNPVVTAMELSTLGRLGGTTPDGSSRFVAGLGHGVTEWNRWIGEGSRSPLTRFADTIRVLRALMAGERISDQGLHHDLADVALDAVPGHHVPLLGGAFGPKSLELMGDICDGLLLAEFAGPSTVRWARDLGRIGDDQTVRCFVAAAIDDDDGDAVRAELAGFLGSVMADRPHVFHAAPFADELGERLADGDPFEVAATLPVEWWHELGAVGTRADAETNLAGLAEAGVETAILFPEPGQELRDAATYASLVGFADSL